MHSDSSSLKTPTKLYNTTISPPIAGIKSRLAKDSADEHVSTFGASLRIPTELLPLVTSTTRPHEIYSTLQNSRDRRLRLLLRRFTNQIQYGCRNTWCDVPTCLSFRKRHATAPLRQYNDVAARALAWKCIEDYANGPRAAGSGFNPGRGQKQDCKTKTSLQEPEDGLCYNVPVVPWYEDPSEYFRRKASSTKQATSTTTQLSNRRRTASCNKTPSLEHASNHVSHSLSQLRAPMKKEDPHHCPKECVQQAAEMEEDHDKADDLLHTDTKPQTQPPTANSNPPVSGRTVRFQVSEISERPEPKRLMDTSSFSQTLFNTRCVRSFDSQVRGPSELHNPIVRPYHEDQSGKPFPINETRLSNGNDPIKQVPTFKLLPTSALIWLRHASSRQPDHQSADHIVVNKNEQPPTELDEFARQSLHYCLSNPYRLMASAQCWHHFPTHRAVKKARSDPEAFKLLNSAVKVAREAEAMICRSSSEPQLPSVKGVVQAINLLSKVQPFTDIMSHLFAALQHAYILPPSLVRSRHLSRLTSARDDHRRLSEKSLSAHNHVEPQIFSGHQKTFLNDDQTAHLSILIVLALINVTELLSKSPIIPWYGDDLVETSGNYLICRDFGHVFPHAYLHAAFSHQNPTQAAASYRAVLMRIDANDDMHFLRLLESLADVISHRLALHETMLSTKSASTRVQKSKNIVERLIQHVLRIDEGTEEDDSSHCAWVLLDSMCLLLLKTWDRQPIIRRTSPVSGALQMLAGLYRNRIQLGIPAINFSFRFIADAFDDVKMPVEWMAFREDSRQMHILSFSFLFEPATLVKYFRAINIETMRKAYEYASINYRDARVFLTSQPIPVYGGKEILAAMRPHMAHYFVLTIGRTKLLEDAIDQIWRRQKQELMRPLKVVLGKEEGEDGLDHGGVQQEFFRLVFAEAMNQDFGMFTVDDQTRMAWFRPGSLEPLYKFEALGILMSLAVYNGLTLPLTLPLAFYRRLLKLKVKHLEHIEDGWPSLAKGLQALLDWKDGDVGDIMARTYEFSYEGFYEVVTVDMTRVRRDDAWPALRRRKSKDRAKTATFEVFNNTSLTPPSEDDQMTHKPDSRLLHRLRALSHELPGSSTPLSILSSNSYAPSFPSSPASPALYPEAPLVTNANRHDYVKDYIFWLTNKSVAPQYEAFAKGFYTCLDPVALSIFTPEALQSVVEGHAEIDIDGLEATTTYDDYDVDDQTIVDFWSVVRDFSPEQHGKLLEFVTASQRVPVNGISNVTFLIQKNGVSDERLPSSSTCYGRLLLPKYSSKEILREKLAKAIENSVGFGSL